jgi:hypothetical protein
MGNLISAGQTLGQIPHRVPFHEYLVSIGILQWCAGLTSGPKSGTRLLTLLATLMVTGALFFLFW